VERYVLAEARASRRVALHRALHAVNALNRRAAK